MNLKPVSKEAMKTTRVVSKNSEVSHFLISQTSTKLAIETICTNLSIVQTCKPMEQNTEHRNKCPYTQSIDFQQRQNH